MPGQDVDHLMKSDVKKEAQGHVKLKSKACFP